MALDLDAEDAFVLDLLFDDDPLMYALMTGEESDLEQFFLPQHVRRMEQWRTVEDVVNDDTSSSADDDDPMNGNDNAIPASRGQYPRRPRHERDPFFGRSMSWRLTIHLQKTWNQFGNWVVGKNRHYKIHQKGTLGDGIGHRRS